MPNLTGLAAMAFIAAGGIAGLFIALPAAVASIWLDVPHALYWAPSALGGLIGLVVGLRVEGR